MTKPGKGRQCRWCRAPLPSPAKTGRPREYCRHSCRQRDYEARVRNAELGLTEGELVVTRAELDALRDELYVLQAAIEDVDGDLAQSATAKDLKEALDWVLAAARPLVAHQLSTGA